MRGRDDSIWLVICVRYVLPFPRHHHDTVVAQPAVLGSYNRLSYRPLRRHEPSFRLDVFSNHFLFRISIPFRCRFV